MALAGPVRAGEQAPRCFKVQDQRGRVEQICESAGFVTIESAPADGEAPSARAERAHALSQRDAFGGDAADPSRRPDWSGLRVGLGPWGALHAPGRNGGIGVAARIGYDVAAQSPSPFVFGLLLDQTGRTSAAAQAPGARGGAPVALTSLDLRIGYALENRFMPYVVAGLAMSDRRIAPLDGGTVGAGLAYAVDRFWTLSIDYRHVGLKAVAPGTGPAPTRPAGPVAVDSVNAVLLYRFL